MSSNSLLMTEEYRLDTVEAWDNASWNFKKSCDKANEDVTVRGLLETDWKVWNVKTWMNWVENVIESIDWVWTKVQIYTNRFNYIVEQQEKWKISSQDLLDESVEIWERMLHDLIAMNVDDLREWEMAVAVTNIIDINHLKWIRWKVFTDSMWIALKNVIKEIDIAMTAGETAVLRNPQSTIRLAKVIDEISQNILNEIIKDETTGAWKIFPKAINNKIKKILEIANWKKEIILKDLEFNIWWTWLWVVWGKEKLTKIKKWQAIIYFEEELIDHVIIWPRSNWITNIRIGLEKLAWEWWENLIFEGFLEKIWNEKSTKLSQELKNECSWLLMWDIATWKTTVFNPFISRVLLWWLDSDPKVNISSIIHVTWNPWRKISEWLKWDKNLAVDLDITNIKIPQIIEILQTLLDMKDDDAIWSWNMWVPEAIICDEDDIDAIIYEADKLWFVVWKIWNVVERVDKNIAWTIKWVWIGNSEISINEKVG